MTKFFEHALPSNMAYVIFSLQFLFFRNFTWWKGNIKNDVCDELADICCNIVNQRASWKKEASAAASIAEAQNGKEYWNIMFINDYNARAKGISDNFHPYISVKRYLDEDDRNVKVS